MSKNTHLRINATLFYVKCLSLCGLHFASLHCSSCSIGMDNWSPPPPHTHTYFSTLNKSREEFCWLLYVCSRIRRVLQLFQDTTEAGDDILQQSAGLDDERHLALDVLRQFVGIDIERDLPGIIKSYLNFTWEAYTA